MGVAIRFAFKYAVGGCISFIVPRMLVALGMPLDQWIVKMADLIQLYISKEAALWTATCILAVLLYFAPSIWNALRRQRTAVDLPAVASSVSPAHQSQHDPRHEMILTEALQYVGQDILNRSTGNINRIHDFLGNLRQHLRDGHVRSWGRPHLQYPPDRTRTSFGGD